jgi:hypothetical protein
MKRTRVLVSMIALFTSGVFCGWGLRRSAQPARTTVLKVSANADSLDSARREADLKPLSPDAPVVRLQQIASQTNGNKRTRAIAQIAEGLNESQIRAALAELEKTHLRENDKIRAHLITQWGRLNPRAAIGYVESIKNVSMREAAIRAAVKGWAEKDLEGAREWALTLHGSLKEGALSEVIEIMAAGDPKAAFAMMKDFSPTTYGSLAEHVFDLWTERDPQEAADHVTQIEKGRIRDEAMVAVASRWASRDITEALAWAEKMWDRNLSRSETWGTRMPASMDAITSVLQTWFDQDADAALRWVQDVPDDAKKGDLMKLLLGAAGDRDPEQVADIITSKLPPGRMRDRVCEDLAFRWAFNDQAGALAWIERQTDVQMQQLFLSHLVFQMSGENAKAAVELAEKLGGSKMEGTISQALMGWAGADPAAAAAWVDQQTANWNYYDSVAYSWGRKDPQSASAWVNALPAGPAKDRFLQEVATVVKRRSIEPTIAAQWLAGISDTTTRTTAYTNLARAWLAQDKEAALTWIENAPLDQPTKTELLKTHAK